MTTWSEMMKITTKVRLLIGTGITTPMVLGLVIALAAPAASPTKADAALAKQQQKVELLKEYSTKKTLTDYELAHLLGLVGFQGEALKTAWAVSKKESGGRPIAHNKSSATGDNSYGLFQINMYKELEAKRKAKFNLGTNADLFDPVRNAQIAFFMSKGGKDWSAWHGVTDKTKELRSKFPGNPGYMKSSKKRLTQKELDAYKRKPVCKLETEKAKS